MTDSALHLVTAAPNESRSAYIDAGGYLAALARPLQIAELRVDTSVCTGEPGAEIIREARTRKAELIVMASRAVGSRSILALTSVARHVLTESPCPVLVVGPSAVPSTRLRTLLVPVDGSPGSACARRRARTGTRQRRIALLQVVVPVSAEVRGLAATCGNIDTDWEDLARTSACTYVHSLAR